MDGAELRKGRLKRGLTQDQVANAITTANPRRKARELGEGHRWDQGEVLDCITQAFVSRMENRHDEIPRTERMLDSGLKLPSIHDALEELLGLPDDELRERVGGKPERGPYRPRHAAARS